MITDTSEIPAAFIALGWRALLLLLAAAAVVAAAMSVLFVAVTADVFTWLTVAALVGAIFGMLIAVSVVFAVRRAFGGLREWFELRQDIERLQAEALLREREPQPFVEIERPILVNKPIAVEPADKINDVPIAAVEYFVQQLCRGVPFTQRTWDRFELPGGYAIGSFEAYARLIDPLVAVGAIIGRTGQEGGNKPGVLAIRDAAVILTKLREWERGRK